MIFFKTKERFSSVISRELLQVKVEVQQGDHYIALSELIFLVMFYIALFGEKFMEIKINQFKA